MYQYNSFVAFDFETTGFTPPCKIIEVGAVKVVNGVMTEKFQSLINPCIPIPYHITGITGIDNAMVKNAPTLDVVLPKFVSFIEGMPIAAHNASFDMKFLRYYAAEAGIKIENEVIDSLHISRRKYPQLHKHDLQTVARHINATQETAHRALSDAMVVFRILTAM